jgi:cytochrome b involved in lipid metabolism
VAAAAAVAFTTPPTTLTRFAQRNTAERRYKTEYSDSDGSDVRDRAIDAVRLRALESLQLKGDTAAVAALRADTTDIVVKIDGVDVDVTQYAREHPGGAAVLRKFHGKDASKAFHAAKHSKAALDRMRALQPAAIRPAKATPASRVGKLFTAEDRSQVHKVLGLWCLGHYVLRIHHGIWSADATGGLRGMGAVRTRCLVESAPTPQHFIAQVNWLLPHALLSLSSVKFHVPRERVAKNPMIWQEFRAHNIIFALRSFACAALAAASLGASPWARARAALGAAGAVLASLVAADVATAKLREDASETTTDTMPYWPGAAPATVRRFKAFYAHCQWMATLGCLANGNPLWPLCIALPIQLASLLMTLVRKGLLTARGYHVLYAASLCVPFVVGLARGGAPFLALPPAAYALLCTRRCLGRAPRGKYLVWAPVLVARILAGDHPLFRAA